VVAQYDPAVHASHPVDPVEISNVPARQLEHTVADAAEYFPVLQIPVTAVRPVVAQYDPAVHASHPVDPVEISNVPVRQLEHTVADAAEYFPAAQTPVTADRPEVAQYDPAGHALHEP